MPSKAPAAGPLTVLLDASVLVPLYVARSKTELKVRARIRALLDAAKVHGKQQRRYILYVPNFCVAEVFNVFRKLRYGNWNSHVKKQGGCIDRATYDAAYDSFQGDIHNGKRFYHYELSRYHLINTALISPIDHHYAFQRSRHKKKNPSPMSTFDLLVVAMGIELVRLYGHENVLVLSSDNRIVKILERAAHVSSYAINRLELERMARFTGRNRFSGRLFPAAVDPLRAKQTEFEEALRLAKPKAPSR